MKLRAKFGDDLLEVVTVSHDDTVGSLITKLTNLFHIKNSSTQLSLNGSSLLLERGPLLDENQDSLSILGLVAGDLLYVFGTTDCRVCHIEMVVNSSKDSGIRCPRCKESESANGNFLSESSSAPKQMRTTTKQDNNTLLHKVHISPFDDTTRQIFVKLCHLYRPINNFIKFCLQIHCFMVECRFSAIDKLSGCTVESDNIDLGCQHLSNYYLPSTSIGQLAVEGHKVCTFYYHYDDAADCRVELRLATVNGDLVICYAAVVTNELADKPLFSLTLNYFSSRHISTDNLGVCVYRDINSLQVHFKDSVCESLRHTIHYHYNLPMRGLLALPNELIVHIASQGEPIDVCHLGASCVRLSNLYQDNNIWRRLCRSITSKSALQQHMHSLDVNSNLAMERAGVEVNYFQLFKKLAKGNRSREKYQPLLIYHLPDIDDRDSTCSLSSVWEESLAADRRLFDQFVHRINNRTDNQSNG